MRRKHLRRVSSMGIPHAGRREELDLVTTYNWLIIFSYSFRLLYDICFKLYHQKIIVNITMNQSIVNFAQKQLIYNYIICYSMVVVAF